MKNAIILVLAIISGVLGAILFANIDNIGSTSDSIQNTENNATNNMIVRSFSGKTLAKADGIAIKEQEIKERLNFVMGEQAKKVDLSKLSDDQIIAISKEIAVQRKVLKAAYDKGIHLDSELQNRLNDLIENIYKEKLLEQIAAKGISNDEVKKLYEDLVSKAKNSSQYKVKHILLKNEAEAKEVRAKLKKSKFSDLAKKHSNDKLSAANGGDLGYIFPQEYVVEFSDAVKKLKRNEVSQPIKTQFGWHIIKMEDKRKAEILPIDKAKPRIEKQLGSKTVKQYIDTLSQNINVELVK